MKLFDFLLFGLSTTTASDFEKRLQTAVFVAECMPDKVTYSPDHTTDTCNAISQEEAFTRCNELGMELPVPKSQEDLWTLTYWTHHHLEEIFSCCHFAVAYGVDVAVFLGVKRIESSQPMDDYGIYKGRYYDIYTGENLSELNAEVSNTNSTQECGYYFAMGAERATPESLDWAFRALDCDRSHIWANTICVEPYVDECEKWTPCGENEQCTNTDGSYDCSCQEGYHKEDVEGGYQCVDDDECKDGTYNCDFNEKCVNVDGSFLCDCKVGFVLVDEECKVDERCNSNGGAIPDWLTKWPERRGCPYPTCDAKLEIVDAWQGKKGRMGKQKVYGWAAIISFGEEEFDSENGGNGWTTLVRLPPGTTNGNFQVWNARFFNSYSDESGFYIVIENKWGGWGPKNDRHDKSSFILVAERTNISEMPHALFWNVRNRRHKCYQPNMSARSTDILEAFLEKTDRTIDADVQKLTIRGGKIIKARTAN